MNYWIVEVNGTNQAMCSTLDAAKEYAAERQAEGAKTRIKPTKKFGKRRGGK